MGEQNDMEKLPNSGLYVSKDPGNLEEAISRIKILSDSVIELKKQNNALEKIILYQDKNLEVANAQVKISQGLGDTLFSVKKKIFSIRKSLVKGKIHRATFKVEKLIKNYFQVAG